jgi:hypothetical protein
MDEHSIKFQKDIEIIRDCELFDKKTQDIRKSLLLLASICILLTLNNLTLKSFLGLAFENTSSISVFSGALAVVVFYEYLNFVWNVYSNHRDKRTDKTIAITTFKICALGIGYANIKSNLDFLQSQVALGNGSHSVDTCLNAINESSEYALKEVIFAEEFEHTSNTLKKLMTIFIEFLIPVSLGLLAIYKNHHNMLSFLDGLF